MSNLFVQNGKDSVILITNDVGNKERKDDESMAALVTLGVFTAIAIVAVIVVVAAVARVFDTLFSTSFSQSPIT